MNIKKTRQINHFQARDNINLIQSTIIHKLIYPFNQVLHFRSLLYRS